MSSHQFIKNAFKLSAMSLGLYGFTAQAAVDCSNLEVWQQGQTHVGGSQVQANNNAYEAKWWTQSNPVENSGTDQEWRFLGACDSVVTDNQAPQVTSLTPADGSLFNSGDSVVIDAQASDVDGSVASVEFFVDNVSVAVVSAPPYSTNWQAVAGSHVISAVATDDLGLASTIAKLMKFAVQQRILLVAQRLVRLPFWVVNSIMKIPSPIIFTRTRIQERLLKMAVFLYILISSLITSQSLRSQPTGNLIGTI